MTKRGRKGQLTIFIILAILIVAIVLFIFLFWPKLSTTTSETRNPYAFMTTCIGDHIEDTIETIILQGGTMNLDEDTSFSYQGENIRFLCHTNVYYEHTCHRQVAFLLPSIQNEIQENIELEIEECFGALKRSYEEEGYTVNVKEIGDFGVKIIPQGILIKLGSDLMLNKGNTAEEYRDFAIKQKSGLYTILEVAENIITIEQELGYCDTSVYSLLYSEIDITKLANQDNSHYDDVQLYTLVHRETEEEFKFAIRSLAYPPVPNGF